MVSGPAPATTESLPAFDRPPVGEVALSLEFSPLRGLTITTLGALVNVFRERYPSVQEHGALPSVREEFGPPKPAQANIRFEVLEEAPLPRLWLVSADETRLLQVQRDRFIHNWRRTDDSTEYPHYSDLRASFLREFQAFENFVVEGDLGDIQIAQCELTYANPIPADGATAGLSGVIASYSGTYSDAFLRQPEDVRLSERHLIMVGGRPIGRLHISVDPGLTLKDQRSLHILRLVARGAPEGSSLTDALSFLDLGHEWIVRGFTSFTTGSAHEQWGRTHG